jgi:NO-binding membrane sensor protein with MHYT domain
MRSSFTHDFLLVFSGPLIWAVHFVAIYGFTGVFCARLAAAPQWQSITTWVIVAAGLAAAAAIAACLAVEPKDSAPDNRRFVRRVAAGLALLAIVAIVWETMTVFLVPVCD